MKDKVVLITGAVGGIGSATASRFAGLGMKLALVDLDIEKLNSLVSSLNISSENVIVIAADVRKEAEVSNYVKLTVEKFGKIDIFVNNAGVEGAIAPITATEEVNLDLVLDVNVKGIYFGLKYVLDVMQKQNSGSVINTASVAGFMGSPGMAPYIASKHAVIGLTKTAALEAAPFGIRVNAVCPGPVDNNMMRSIEKKASPENPEAVKTGFVSTIPFGRYASNEDVANLIYFFASDISKYITGTAQRVDGGMAAK